jgi:hypothetical protein
MQCHVLPPAHAHADLQSFEPVETPHPLLVDPPAFATQQRVNPVVAEARPGHRQVANPHPER